MAIDDALVEKLRRFSHDYESTDEDIKETIETAAALELDATGVPYTDDPRAKRLMMLYACELIDTKSTESQATANSRSALIHSLVLQLKVLAREVAASDADSMGA